MSDRPRNPANLDPDPANPERFVRAIIGGRVQGVGFRAWTKAQAEALGLEGFVRNRTSGEVEAVFAGAPASVEAMIRRLSGGPAGARVERIDVTEASERDLARIAGAPAFRQIATI